MTSMEDLAGLNAKAKMTLSYKDDVAKALKKCGDEEEEKALPGISIK